MENKVITDLRWELEQMSSQQLREMLQNEVEKEAPDDDLVLQLLHILEKRDADKPIELGPKSQEAWKKYQSRAMGRVKKPAFHSTWLVRAASLILIAGLLVALVPQQATAGSFWKILTSWTDTVFEYVNIGSEEKEPEEYVFETDNPGLQQVYDAVVSELGVTDPVVTQWLPEGNELVEIKYLKTPATDDMYATFQNGESDTILSFRKMKVALSPQYDKAAIEVVEYEINGIKHSYMRNDSVWVVNWARQNVKCTIFIDCQEEALKQIIRSIY